MPSSTGPSVRQLPIPTAGTSSSSTAKKAGGASANTGTGILNQRITSSGLRTSSADISSFHVPSGKPPLNQKKYVADGFQAFDQAAKLIKDMKHYKSTRDKVDAFERKYKNKPFISTQMKIVVVTGVALYLMFSYSCLRNVYLRWRNDPDNFSWLDWGLGTKRDSVLDV
ncbi:unnamed protein product [Amoebophrya sp. A25]|nr:unnamed protein product [Amoebophrya sp. A25]|eukprot:GSA25T00004761001.1